MKPKYIKHYNNKQAVANEYFGKTYVYKSMIARKFLIHRINNKKRIKRRNNLIDRVCGYRFGKSFFTQTKAYSISIDKELTNAIRS